MKAIHLCLLLLAVIAFTTASAQSDGELPIPVENDNQFPPENIAGPGHDDIIEGSGVGAIDEPELSISSTSELPPEIPLEEIQPNKQLLTEIDSTKDDASSCPEKCLCNFEANDFVVDCSGQQLVEFPDSIDLRTTKLKLQNNKLTEIPKTISSLTNLKVLNASNNMIKDLVSGSISELPELEILDLGSNRLIEYPRDLKNGFGLTKLQVLNLGGNDMRTALESETLAKFTSLEKLIIPTSTHSEQLEDSLCNALKDTLRIICVESCNDQEHSCPNGSDDIDVENELLDAKLPGEIFADNIGDEDYHDPISIDDDDANKSGKDEDLSQTEVKVESSTLRNEANNTGESKSANDFSLLNAVIEQHEGELAEAPQEEQSKIEEQKIEPTSVSKLNSVSQPKEAIVKANADSRLNKAEEIPNGDSKTDSHVKVGATTTDTKSGGVDKSVIGMIVAGMVVVVAVVTIKKNWSSIRRKFSSNTRTPNDRPSGNANGTTPEEVPLQDKSPV